MLKEEHAAQEVLQESLIKVWKKGHQYDPSKAKLFTWLLRIVRNRAIDYLRAQKSRSDAKIQMTNSTVYKEKVELKPEHLDVADHLERLERKYRDVLSALFFKGMTQAEVSDQLGIPLGTVKTRLKIGLRELRKVFKDSTILVTLILLFFA